MAIREPAIAVPDFVQHAALRERHCAAVLADVQGLGVGDESVRGGQGAGVFDVEYGALVGGWCWDAVEVRGDCGLACELVRVLRGSVGRG